MIEETMTHEKHKTIMVLCFYKPLWFLTTKMVAVKSETLIVVCIYDKTGCINLAFRLSKKENILILNKRYTTKLANAAYPESHSVPSSIVYGFHRANVSSIRRINFYS